MTGRVIAARSAGISFLYRGRGSRTQVTEMTSVGDDMAIDVEKINSIVAWNKREEEKIDNLVVSVLECIEENLYGGA